MAFSLQPYMDMWWRRNDDKSSPYIQIMKQRRERDRERATGISIQNGDRLNEGVIIEILSWLPVKDLLQHKSVCKSWYAIISSPSFISKHLKNYYQHNNDWRDCLLAQYYVEPQLIAMAMDETPRVVAREKLECMSMNDSFVCGPCDGLYCRYSGNKSAFWNPATNELKVLPLITFEAPYMYINTLDSVGFGYDGDESNRDYKMVVIKRHWGFCTTGEGQIELKKDPQSVFVYSLRNNSWTYCGDLRRYYWLDFSKCYNFVNGCCYWIEASRKWGNGTITCDPIISFDMTTHKYEEINLPCFSQQSASKCLAIYDDSLALLSLGEDHQLEIWTLNTGVWCMKNKLGPFLDVMDPVGHWNDNILILETNDRNLVLLDPESQDIKYLSFQFWTFCNCIFAYKESLVSLKGENWGHNDEDDHGSSDSDMDFGIRELLFRCENSESDSEYGIQELFCLSPTYN